MGFLPVLSSANTIKNDPLLGSPMCTISTSFRSLSIFLSTNRSLWESTGSIKAVKWAAGGQCRGVIFSKLGWINTSNQQWEQWNRTAPKRRNHHWLPLPDTMTIVKATTSTICVQCKSESCLLGDTWKIGNVFFFFVCFDVKIHH